MVAKQSKALADAAIKMIWLALRNITADWSRAANNWKAALNQFTILYGDRLTTTAAQYGRPACPCIRADIAGDIRYQGQVSERLTHRNSERPPTDWSWPPVPRWSVLYRSGVSFHPSS